MINKIFITIGIFLLLSIGVFYIYDGQNRGVVSYVQIEDDLNIDSSINSYSKDGNLIIEYTNPGNEKVWIEGLKSDEYIISKEEIIIYDYQPNKQFRVHIGKESDIYSFGNAIGYNILNDTVVIWNTQDAYYFNKSSGIQLTNHYEDYWSKNVFCIGYYSEGEWNRIKCADELNNFNKNIQTDNETYVNATLWKDITYSGYDMRLGVNYYLGLDDKNLSITIYGKNIGIDIPFDLGFAWKVMDLNVPFNETIDKIRINNTNYRLDGTYDLLFKDMKEYINTSFPTNQTGPNGTIIYNYSIVEVPLSMYRIHDKEDKVLFPKENFLRIGWDENLDYTVKMHGDGNQENFYIALLVNAGHFNPGQEKSTTFYWIDALTDNIVAYYKLQETSGVVVDSLGVYNGTNNGPTRGATGIIENAFDFETSSDDYVVISPVINLAENRSLSLWFKFESIGSGYNTLYDSRVSGNNPTDIALFYSGSNSQLRALVGYDGSLGVCYPPGTHAMTTGIWYHIVLNVDASGDTVDFWVNGTKVLTDSCNPGSVTPTVTRLGARPGAPSDQYPDGIMDEVGVWDRFLTNAEIAELYNSGAGLTYPFIGADEIPPYFTTIPANTTINYTQGFGVDFDAEDETEFDSYAINWTTLFQINQSGWLENSTVNIAVGIYLINVTINDTMNNLNSTIYKVTVNKATPTGSLTNTDTWTEPYLEEVTIGLSESNVGDGDVDYNVSRDGVDKGTGETVTLGVGTYDYVLNTTGGANWTANASMDAETLTVEKIAPIGSLTGASPITYGTVGDVEGTESNTGDGGCDYKLYRDGVEVSNPDTTVLGVAVYNYVYNTTGCANYTANASMDTFALTVNKAVPEGSLTSDLSWTINETQEVVIGLSESNTGDGDVTYKVYRDGVDKGTGETWSPAFGTYDYVLNTTGGANWTSNSSMDTQTLTVNDITLPSISIIYPTAITYSENVSSLNYTYTETNPDSCWYSVDDGVTNSSAVNMGTNFTGITSVGGSNTWIVYCNDTSNNINSDSVTFTLNILWSNAGYPYSDKDFRTTKFITVDGNDFMLGSQQYRFLGADSYYLADYATNLTYDDDGNEINNSRQAVLEILNEAQYLNINVIRTWASSQGSDDSHWIINESGGHYNLFEVGEPGNYSEDMFKALDWVIYEASKRNIRLQLVLINNWNDYGGMRWYAQKSPTTNKTYQWVNDSDDDNYWLFHDQFYDDENTRQYFRNYINHTLNRNNTYSGLLYKDDPAIFSWLLANEPRAKSDGVGRDLIRNWTINMTAYIKSIDSNHLVGLGIEGWGYVETWGEGTDMIADHNNTGVDFATYALHPDQWQYFAERSEHDGGGWVTEDTGTNDYIDWWTNDTGLSYNNRYEGSFIPAYTPALGRYGYDNWVAQNVKWANELGMPVLLQEAGYLTVHEAAIKDRFYQQMIHNFYNEGGDGLMFWTLNHDDYYYSTEVDGDMDDGYGFYVSDDAFLKNKSKGVLDSIDFTLTDNNGGSWVNQMNSYKYDFIVNIGFASDTVIDNCTLFLNVSNGNEWTGYYADQSNTSAILNNEDYVFEKQFNDTEEEVYWYTECSGDSTTITSDVGHIQIQTGVPVVTLYSPESSGFSNNNTVEFIYDVTETNGLLMSSCELFIDDVLNKTDFTVTMFVNQTFLSLLSDGTTYDWYVRCTDTDDNSDVSETISFTVDSTYPQIEIVYPSNNSNHTSNTIEVNYTVSDINLDSCWYSNDTYSVNTSLGTGGNCLNITGITWSEGQHNVTTWANDSGGNENSSSITFFVDSLNPSVSSLTESPSDPAIYSSGATYEFNATITDTNLQTVLFEFDGTNYTPSISGNVYNFSISDLSVGVYNYRWFANDSYGNVNNTEAGDYTIDKATPTGSLAGASPIDYLVAGDVTGTEANTGDGGCSYLLYRDGVSVSNPDTTVLGVGAYNYVYNTTGCTNYLASASLDTFALTVNKIALTGMATGTSPIDYLVAGDVEGTESNTGDGDVTYKLYREGVEVSNPDTDVLGVGVWNYVYNSTGGANYSSTASIDTFALTINKATPSFSTSLTSPINYLTASNYLGSESNTGDGGCSYSLKREGVEIDTGSSVGDTNVLGAGTWEYNYSTSGCTNYTAGSDVLTLTVNKATPTGTATGTSPIDYLIAGDVVGSESNSGDGDVLYKLYRDGTEVSSPDTTVLGAGVHNYIWNSTEGANYSAVASLDTFALTVNQISPTGTISGTTPIKEETAGDVEGTESNFGDGDVTYRLYREGVEVSNPDTDVLGIGVWNYVYNSTGGTNYTSNSSLDTFILTVTLDPSIIRYDDLTKRIIQLLQALIVLASSIILIFLVRAFLEEEMTLGEIIRTGLYVGLGVFVLIMLMSPLVSYIAGIIT